VFTILAVAYVAASMAAPRLSARRGRSVIGAGALVLATGHALLLLAVADIGIGGSVGLLIPGLLLVGAGMGTVLAPLATTILQSLDPERAGPASGMLTTMQNIGNALGVAVTGVIFFGACGAATRTHSSSPSPSSQRCWAPTATPAAPAVGELLRS